LKHEQGKTINKHVLIGPWPYWAGAFILGLLNVLLFVIFRRPWGVTAGIARWGFDLWKTLGGHPERWAYFREINSDILSSHTFFNQANILNMGLVFGVMLAVLLSSHFRVKRVKSRSQLILGITGGIMMGYGARLAFGCNIGALLGGIASQSLHGWVFGVFLFIGASLGTLFIRHYVLKKKLP